MSTEYDEFQCYKGFLTAKSPTDNSFPSSVI